MFRALSALLVVAVVAAAPAARGDEAEAEAARLLVEVSTLVEQAVRTAETGERVSLFGQALSKIDEIVSEHSETDLAVRLETGLSTGVVDRTEIERLWYIARIEHCVFTWDRSCLLDVLIELDEITAHPRVRPWTNMFVAEALADEGHVAQAILKARSLTEPSFRLWALSRIGAVLAQRGRHGLAKDVFEEAMSAVADVDLFLEKSIGLARIGYYQAKSGYENLAEASLDRALELSGGIKGGVSLNLAGAYMAVGYAELGYATSAQGMVDAILRSAAFDEDIPLKIDIVVGVALTNFALGRIDYAIETLKDAVEIAEKFEILVERYQAFAKIAYASGLIGDRQLASQLLSRLEGLGWRALGSAVIASGRAEFGDVAGMQGSICTSLANTRDLSDLALVAEVTTYLLPAIREDKISADFTFSCDN